MIPAVPPARAMAPAGRPPSARQWMSARFDNAVLTTRYMLLPWLRAHWRSRDLEHLSGPPTRRRQRGVVAVVPFYGNFDLLPTFLRHHRRLGVDEFVFLD